MQGLELQLIKKTGVRSQKPLNGLFKNSQNGWRKNILLATICSFGTANNLPQSYTIIYDEMIIFKNCEKNYQISKTLLIKKT
jgi:hypothetical protein